MSGFREAPDEQGRIASLLRLLPPGGRVLEIGARDGYITRLLADRYEEVVALDLTKPTIEAPRVHCVAGDVRSLDFPADHFDVVLCSEVLEHIPPQDLAQACRGTCAGHETPCGRRRALRAGSTSRENPLRAMR